MRGRVLHLSHHIGCLRDQHYVLRRLGFQVTSREFPLARHRVTWLDAERLWWRYRHEFNDFDYIVVSDTAPMSRVFLQHLRQFRSKLVIWICNRFDYNMDGVAGYYRLFAAALGHPQVRIVPYTDFEADWCRERGIEIGDPETIRPLGRHAAEDDAELPQRLLPRDTLGASGADLYVTGYHNDNRFMDLAGRCAEMGLTCAQGSYREITRLATCRAYITLPDAFSKFVVFELLHQGIPVLLPSAALLHDLAQRPGYFFNVTGSGGTQRLTPGLIARCEWYDRSLGVDAHYFDDFAQIPELLEHAVAARDPTTVARHSATHEARVMAQWERLYAEF